MIGTEQQYCMRNTFNNKPIKEIDIYAKKKRQEAAVFTFHSLMQYQEHEPEAFPPTYYDGMSL